MQDEDTRNTVTTEVTENTGNTETTEGTDLLGAPLTTYEREVLRLYEDLKALTGRDDLPPCVARNLRQALASMWQATNDLDLQFEQLYTLGT